MVLWMSIYNVALQHGAINGEVVAAAWLGFPVAYIFAVCCDRFVASPLAKGFAFKYLVTPGKSSPLAMTLAVSSCMVVPMVIIMSLYGACEGLFHMPGGPLANLQALPMMWLVNIPHNFVMALPWNLLVAGPISHFVFRRAFLWGRFSRRSMPSSWSRLWLLSASSSLRDLLSAGDLLGWSPKRG